MESICYDCGIEIVGCVCEPYEDVETDEMDY